MQTLFEEVPKLSIEDGIDDRVEGAVDIAEPRHHAHQGRRDVAVVAARSSGVEDKEGSPTEQEGTCRNINQRCLVYLSNIQIEIKQICLQHLIHRLSFGFQNICSY